MPPISYSMPPWIGQGANPAAHYAQGVQIGTRIGAEQAAQQFQQQQMLLEQQKQAFQASLQTEKINLDVADAIRKHQAQNAYAQLVSQGVSPQDALMRAGPAMGESVNELLRTQALMQNRQQMYGMNMLRAQIAMQNAQSQARRVSDMESAAKQREADFQQRLKAQQEQFTTREERLEKKDKAAILQKIQKDPDLVSLQSEVRIARSALAEIDQKRYFIESHRERDRKKAQENLAAAQAAAQEKWQELLQLNGIEPGDVSGVSPTTDLPTPAPATAAPAAANTNEWKTIGGFKVRPVP